MSHLLLQGADAHVYGSQMDAAGLGLFSAAAVPAQDQPGSPQSIISDGSPFGGLTTDASASASLKMGQPASSISVGSAQSLSLSSGSVSLSKAAASLSSQSRVRCSARWHQSGEHAVQHITHVISTVPHNAQ